MPYSPEVGFWLVVQLCSIRISIRIVTFFMSTIPFDEPKFLTARKSSGFVDIPDNAKSYEEEWTGRKSQILQPKGKPSSSKPPTLNRSKTLSGNIIVIESENGEPEQAFWLQRKIGKLPSSDGVVRLAYRLRRRTSKDAENWELDVDEFGDPSIVKVNMLHSSVLEKSSEEEQTGIISCRDELSALQMIASYGSTESSHVVGTPLVATCSNYVYVVLPYYPEGTLLQYCLFKGTLDEAEARFYFQQILQGLQTLQTVGLCHRNICMDSVELERDRADITNLAWAIRFNGNAPKDEDAPIPAPGGTLPQFIAPEYFGVVSGAWDGFAADLWAAGLMLYSMVVGCNALFVAPIPEDKLFDQICVKGKIGEEAKRYGKASQDKEILLSDDLVNLLQGMLKVNPKDRLTLSDVMEHPWVKEGDETAVVEGERGD
eukprot:Nitzschia sp. Nitz4//scaffold207_size38617//31156//32532//NITZ4_007681-RA/size38617-snap-gene-0.3-mRNA-1//1//CDS//3329541623//6124//frame0